MPYQIEWFLPKQIVYVQFIGDLTEDDLSVYAGELSQYIESSDAKMVHLLLDDSRLEKFPRSITQFRALFAVLKDPKVGWNLAFGTRNPFANIVSVMVGKVLNLRFRRFNTREDALHFVQQMDSSLPRLEHITFSKMGSD